MEKIKIGKLMSISFKTVVGCGIGYRLGKFVLGVVDKGASIVCEKLVLKMEDDPEFVKVKEKRKKEKERILKLYKDIKSEDE